jgi:uncharacterized protein
MNYHARIVDQELAEQLRAIGAVLIEGPRACGKTETARQVAASEVRLDTDESARQAAAVDPSLVLDGAPPRLIDEWQVEPAIWNHVRRAVDNRGLFGQFILTGSSVPLDDVTRHTGALRISRMRMRPMSLFETGDSSGDVSLLALLKGEGAKASGAERSVADLASLITVGGWPALVGRSAVDAQRALRSYVDDVSRADASRIDDRRRDPAGVRAVVDSLARNVATHATGSRLAADAGGPDGPMREDTVREYLNILSRLMVIEDQPAWGPHMRSRVRVRSAVKRHFADPSLAVAALGVSPGRLVADLNALGFLFESLVVRDLRVYAQSLDAQVLQYRDSQNREIDAIVEARDGTWGAFEVKLGGDAAIDGAAASLLKFAHQIDTDTCGEPGTLAVIVGTGGYGYVRSDGVAVVPIGALGP